jgi:two-component system, OmpR family, sensor histidine kinase KdpD
VSRRRIWSGLAVGAAGLAGLTAALAAGRSPPALPSITLLYLVPVVAAAVIGGVWPALAAAATADLLVNFFFIPPYHTFVVQSRDHVLVLVVYVLVAAVVSLAVEVAASQWASAARREVEVNLLARVTAEPVADQSLTRLLDQVRDTFGMSTVALLEAGPTGEHTVASVGQPASVNQPAAPVGPPVAAGNGPVAAGNGPVAAGNGPVAAGNGPVAADGALPLGRPSISAPAGNGLRLAAWGPEVFAEDRRTLNRLASAAARLLEAQRLSDQARQARDLAEIDRVRSALLAAVGHDLRTPLAGIKAAVSSLRQPGLDLPPEDRDALLSTVEESADRLDSLIDNLLSMSRLQAGVLSVHAAPVALDAVVAAALLHTTGRPRGGAPDRPRPQSIHYGRIEVDIPDDLPMVVADPGLLERVVANLVANAQAASPSGRAVHLIGRVTADRVLLQVVDHGPGVPVDQHERIFAPFQRLHDRTTSAGLGLGLAIARGFTQAMGGTLTPSETPGGGLTMTVAVPVAEPAG